ncbi:MAG: tRNA uridine-5-carboxymethylaminomethyl(34) synthesis GTPase MnmE [Deltaproteobacteria bacterium]
MTGINDTIAAISTPIGESGIGIVRLSGKRALSVADGIFVPKDGKKPSVFKSHTVHYGWITGSSGNIIDEVILTVMRAPKTYTKEDIVEINCHGGIIALRAVLDLVLAQGVRLAEPGEFTRRAFLNGRIDLAQAEAVLDIIKAKTDSSLKISIGQLKGTLSDQINRIRKNLLDMLSLFEAGIDFPDEEIDASGLARSRMRLENINQELKRSINASSYGRTLREGVSVVICGRANVGKSSLLNAILRQERAIVTPVAGTTRDTIEEVINVKGIPVKIADTAGIIEPRGLVERKAVQRAKDYIDSADAIILVFDGSKRLGPEDRLFIKKMSRKPVIAVINKSDLKQKFEKQKISKSFTDIISVSAKKNKNIDLIEDALVNLIFKGKVVSPEPELVSNLRHINKLKNAQKSVARSINSLDNKLSSEFVSQDVKDALAYLDEILGTRFSEDLLDKIFSEFCVGK